MSRTGTDSVLVAAPHITSHFAHVNALFLQPTPWCARNCNGCYVKGFEDINNVKFSQAKLFEDILEVINRPSLNFSPVNAVLLANQVTLALDRRPSSKFTYVNDSYPSTPDKRRIMMNLFQKFIEAKHMSIGGEFHVTVHTVRDLADYLDSGIQSSYTPPHLHMLSASVINPKDVLFFDRIRDDIAPLINWNLTIDPIVNIDAIKKTFPTIAEHVDSIYLVLHKPATGQLLDPRALKAHQDFLRFIRTMPQNIQDKVHIDGCIADSRKFLATGYGCSSNVSRFQIWPDGSVTGCAYNQHRVTPGAENLTELLNNLVRASKVYEFNQCKIPVHLDSKNKYVRRRSNHYLEIVE